MRLFARGLTLLGAGAGILILIQAYRLREALGPIISIPFVFMTGGVGLVILLVSLHWFWRLGRDPYGEQATEHRFRQRFRL